MRVLATRRMTSYAALFASQSDAYKLFRPTYNKHLFDTVLAYHKGQREVAVDIACGSGQATQQLGELFEEAIGVDGSIQQIQQAANAEKTKIRYLHGSAESCPVVPDASADLVTVAQALHWFDLAKFYSEAARILKPNGTLAIWVYSTGWPVVIDPPASSDTARVNAKLKDAFMRTYAIVLGPYWDERRKLVDAEYAGLEPSKVAPDLFEKEERARSMMTLEMPLSAVAGYVTTWSSHATFLKKHPEVVKGSEADPAAQLLDELARILTEEGCVVNAAGTSAGKGDPTSTRLMMEWPLALILATKKAGSPSSSAAPSSSPAVPAPKWASDL